VGGCSPPPPPFLKKGEKTLSHTLPAFEKAGQNFKGKTKFSLL